MFLQMPGKPRACVPAPVYRSVSDGLSPKVLR
jgi:hypothetical protein